MAQTTSSSASAAARIATDHFSPLPAELHLAIGELLDANSLASLRATSRIFASRMHDQFFKTACFNVIFDEEHFAGFEELVNSYGSNIKKIRLGNRYVLDSLVVRMKKWGGLLGQRGDPFPKLRGKDNKVYEKALTPDGDFVDKFIRLLFKLPAVEFIGVYNEYLQVVMSYPLDGANCRVFEEVVNIHDAEKADRARGWPVAEAHDYTRIRDCWFACEAMSTMWTTTIMDIGWEQRFDISLFPNVEKVELQLEWDGSSGPLAPFLPIWFLRFLGTESEHLPLFFMCCKKLKQVDFKCHRYDYDNLRAVLMTSLYNLSDSMQANAVHCNNVPQILLCLKPMHVPGMVQARVDDDTEDETEHETEHEREDDAEQETGREQDEMEPEDSLENEEGIEDSDAMEQEGDLDP